MEFKVADLTTSTCSKIKEKVQFIAERNRSEVEHYLQVKLNQIDFITNELKIERDILSAEIDAIVPYISRLSKTKDSLMYPKQISLKCKELRKAIFDNDGSADLVDKELSKEINKLNEDYSVIENTGDSIKEQLRKYRSLIYSIVRNITGKETAYMIEKQNIDLGKVNCNRFNFNVNRDSSFILSKHTVGDWMDDSETILKLVRKELESGRKLRFQTDTLMKNIIDDLQLQHVACNTAFSKQIEQYKECKSELEQDQLQLSHRIKTMKQTVEELQTAIAEKNPYMSVAYSRLNNRSQRPGIELCRDMVEEKLINEVVNLNGINQNLIEKLTTTQMMLLSLRKSEEEVKRKIAEQTMLIKMDEVECLTLRSTVHFHFY